MHHLLLWSHFLTIVARDVVMVICLLAASYYGFACYAAHRFFARKPDQNGGFLPPVTILKPLRGVDRDAYDNFASFCRQSYPSYQVIFGADASDGPAIAIARRIAEDFPDIDVRVVVKPAGGAANPKVGNLAAMLSEAEHSILLISDSDIRVCPTYLTTMVQPMADPRVGVVTCLYRSEAVGFAGTLAALGLSTEGQPSVLAATQLEKMMPSSPRFGSAVGAMGSGILIRRPVLDEVGGFDAIADYLADDYLLGSLPAKAGYRVELSNAVVEHRLDTSSLAGLIQHQMRWNRGIRATRPWGYAGLIFTYGVPASLLLLILSGGSPVAWVTTLLTIGSRLAMVWFVVVRCLDDSVARRALWLVPLRDLLGFALWVGAFFGSTIVWRGKRFRLGEGGRLLPAAG
jgi:ceramide glucosyltransferase